MNNPIDFILPWVNDSEPEWQTQKFNFHRINELAEKEVFGLFVRVMEFIE